MVWQMVMVQTTRAEVSSVWQASARRCLASLEGSLSDGVFICNPRLSCSYGGAVSDDGFNEEKDQRREKQSGPKLLLSVLRTEKSRRQRRVFRILTPEKWFLKIFWPEGIQIRFLDWQVYSPPPQFVAISSAKRI